MTQTTTAPTRITPDAGAPRRAAPSAPPDQRPTWADVDLEAIAANVAALKAQAAAPALIAVVKADGYGHGSVAVARAALAGGADWLAVALVEEGRQLREAGITAPVLLLAEPPVDAIPALLAADLVPAVYRPAFVDALDAEGRRRGRPVDVHLKLDTGMRRVGVPPADWDDAFARLRSAQGLRATGLWSHFAVADEPDHPFVLQQTELFQRGVEAAEAAGLRPQLRHLCNSAGTLHLHDHHWDAVRPGIAIYGLDPAPGLVSPVDAGLRPALSWWSRISLVKRLAAGEAVSYGLRWRALEPTTVATVPVGYADGVPRRLSGVLQVVVRGQRVQQVGTICMDQLLVDVGDLEVEPGDDVALIGEGVSAQDWASWIGTIAYEVVCGVGARVPRVHREP